MHYTISNFVNKWADLLKPTNIQWILGNEGEKEHLLQAIRSRNENAVVHVSARELLRIFLKSKRCCPNGIANIHLQQQ